MKNNTVHVLEKVVTSADGDVGDVPIESWAEQSVFTLDQTTRTILTIREDP